MFSIKNFKLNAAKVAASLCFFSFCLILVNSASASGSFLDLENQEGFSDGQMAQEFGQNANEPTDIKVIVSRVIKIALSLLGIIFVTLLVVAGFKYMTAQGNESQIDDAKKQIIQAIIGIAIILAAWSITYFVLDSTVDATTSSFF